MTKMPLANAQDTYDLGIALGKTLDPGSSLLLEGDLGAGKTTLVQGLAFGMGIREPVVSPTFNLIAEYPKGRMPLYHIDLYRLQPKDIKDLNLESYWEGIEVEKGIVAIEWPDRLTHLPEVYLRVHLYNVDEGREAEITPSDAFDWLGFLRYHYMLVYHS